MTPPALQPDERDRYARHLALPAVGEAGQARLRAARVVVIGAGGLGSPALLYLAAAGVGHLTVADDDVVALSNLQRQILHDTSSVGTPKTASAAARLRALNPHVVVHPVAVRVDTQVAEALVERADVVVDGSDNFATRYAVSDVCATRRIPYVYGSVQGFDGQVAVLCAGEAACYRCLFATAPPPGTAPACGESGVLGVLPGIVGTLQAAEALKLLLGVGTTLAGRLLLVDALRMRFHEIALARRDDCAACGASARADRHQHGVPTNQPPNMTDARIDTGTDARNAPITPGELHARWQQGDRPALVDVREAREWAIARLEGARHVPMAHVPEAAATLDPAVELVVYCHHGMRSDAAARWLREAGFANVRNLTGGIDCWSVEVDPGIQRY